MGFFDYFILWRIVMLDQLDDIICFCKVSYVFEDFFEIIVFLQCFGDELCELLLVVEVIVDEIVFVIVEVEWESLDVYCRVDVLKWFYKFVCEVGCIGVDCVVMVVMKKEGQ